MEIFESNVSLNSKIREVLSLRSCILMKMLEHRRIQYRRGAKVDRVQFSSVTVVSDSLQPHGLQHTVFHCLSFTVTQTLFKFMCIGLVMLSGHLLCHPLLLLLSVFPSTRVFSKESKCQASLCMRFFRKEYWSGLPCPLLGDLPDPGIEPTSFTSPAVVGGFFTVSTSI